jgi:hypothetical protein
MRMMSWTWWRGQRGEAVSGVVEEKCNRERLNTADVFKSDVTISCEIE